MRAGIREALGFDGNLLPKKLYVEKKGSKEASFLIPFGLRYWPLVRWLLVGGFPYIFLEAVKTSEWSSWLVLFIYVLNKLFLGSLRIK